MCPGEKGRNETIVVPSKRPRNRGSTGALLEHDGIIPFPPTPDVPVRKPRCVSRRFSFGRAHLSEFLAGPVEETAERFRVCDGSRAAGSGGVGRGLALYGLPVDAD